MMSPSTPHHRNIIMYRRTQRGQTLVVAGGDGKIRFIDVASGELQRTLTGHTNVIYRAIFDSMEKPAFVFDGRNILDHEALHAIGFNVFPIGKPPLKHV